MKIALYPGSFDPITKGHISIINKAVPLFDILYIGIGENNTKKHLFPLEKRINWIKKIFENNPKVKVITYKNLTVDLCREIDAKYIVRGLRTYSDFEYEKKLAYNNQTLNHNIETVFFIPDLKYINISSTIVRDIYMHGGDISFFVPELLIN
ncbi:MAG: pantetheine-phosphate adenylyltransferase [Bacteroidota bacterium]|nr:pantetheine-phosphate adenylyltransferase [Bacteroidota bacterium]